MLFASAFSDWLHDCRRTAELADLVEVAGPDERSVLGWRLPIEPASAPPEAQQVQLIGGLCDRLPLTLIM